MYVRRTMLYAAAAMAFVAAIATPDIASANAPTMSAHASATPVFESFHATVPEGVNESRVYQAPQFDAIPHPVPAIYASAISHENAYGGKRSSIEDRVMSIFATLFVFALIVGLVFYSIRAEIERQRSFGTGLDPSVRDFDRQQQQRLRL